MYSEVLMIQMYASELWYHLPAQSEVLGPKSKLDNQDQCPIPVMNVIIHTHTHTHTYIHTQLSEITYDTISI